MRIDESITTRVDCIVICVDDLMLTVVISC